jgi:predicted house-cleaning noncanonical NTP pyrophosphatase (MazG superfamily)
MLGIYKYVSYLCILLKHNNMNKEKVLEVVNGIIIDQTTQMIEDMSSNEFVEMITDKLSVEGVEIETEEDEEELRDLIGSRVLPLLHKIMEWGIGKELPKMN